MEQNRSTYFCFTLNVRAVIHSDCDTADRCCSPLLFHFSDDDRFCSVTVGERDNETFFSLFRCVRSRAKFDLDCLPCFKNASCVITFFFCNVYGHTSVSVSSTSFISMVMMKCGNCFLLLRFYHEDLLLLRYFH